MSLLIQKTRPALTLGVLAFVLAWAIVAPVEMAGRTSHTMPGNEYWCDLTLIQDAPAADQRELQLRLETSAAAGSGPSLTSPRNNVLCVPPRGSVFNSSRSRVIILINRQLLI